MTDNDPFNRERDLTNRDQLIAECADLAHSMEQQAVASTGGVAIAGHPYPAFLCVKVQKCLEAAVTALKEHAASISAVPVTDDKTNAANAVVGKVEMLADKSVDVKQTVKK